MDEGKGRDPGKAQDLRRTAAGGAIWIAANQVLRIALTIVSTVVVARILSPEDYGVIAMTAPIAAFVIVFQDLGLSAATINARQITPAQANALFWLNMAASAVAGAVMLAAAPVVGWFYGDARAAYVTAASSLVFIATGLGLQHNALLNRELRYAALSKAEMAGMIGNYAVAIGMALVLRSYWALFLGSLVGATIQSALNWSASAFRPSGPTFRGAGSLAAFGGHVTGFNLLNYAARNLDNVLVAKFSGAQAAGLYDRSYRLLLMPLQNINWPVTRLVQPMLVRLVDEPARYRRLFTLACRLVMIASAPAVAVAAILAEPFMAFLLGPGWEGAGRIFLWLGLAGLLQPVGNLTGLLFLTSGRSAAFLRWGFVSTGTIVCAFAIGAPFGPVALAKAYFIVQVLLTPLRIAWSVKGGPVSQSDLYRAQLEPLVGPLLVAFGAAQLLGTMPFAALFAGAVAAAYGAALITSSLTAQGREITRDAWRLASEHLRWPRRVVERRV